MSKRIQELTFEELAVCERKAGSSTPALVGEVGIDYLSEVV